ncbi:hypothetical protein CDD81_2320 [Ophiocordyceps australis]|uniref:Large ribosomal subunit protein mL54 n=1 Tax=Ophiocordyceps australis TaxID=1399860 RepID=A0A2C5YDI2_9HYPO|nr:hypothetical protein CDD81_2320 [Ophiocordyceps australis]
MFCSRCVRAATSTKGLALVRPFSVSSRLRLADPKLSTPITEAGETPQATTTVRSICREGTVLRGLNYLKGGQDPVALRDDDYPEWLWTCLDFKKSSANANDPDAVDEFSKSKRQRRLAAKAQKKTLADGTIEALEPKIPIQHQSINLPGSEGDSIEDKMASAVKRDELKRAMRKERRAKIKESNFLKSM